MNFRELKVKEEIVKALDELGISEPTDIQEKSIPEIKAGQDIIGVSKTGSGKTLAFSASIFDNIKLGQGLQALIVVPVRELAEQVASELRKFAKYLHPHVSVIYGGVSLTPQEHNLRKTDIVVGTPGRLLDHLRRGSLNLSKIKVVVLDEADKMATMGFIEDVETILKATPKTRQTLLFGATISHDIAMLRDRYMRNPKVIKVIVHVDEQLLNQDYYELEARDKFSFLVHLINKENPHLAIVFCSTRRNAELVAKNLQSQNMDAKVIHGGMGQGSRLNVMGGFHRGKPKILVATAVAARGLDIKNVTHIFNYDVPKNSEEYIHQIGRTARAGVSGKAITLLAQHDHANFGAILHRYPIKVRKMPKEEFKRIPFDSGRRHFEHQDHGSQRRRFTGRPRQRYNY